MQLDRVGFVPDRKGEKYLSAREKLPDVFILRGKA